MNNENKNINQDIDTVVSPEEEAGVLVLEGEYTEDGATAETEATRATYMPRFTEASEKYRRKGDAKIRERLGIKSVPEREEAESSDEIKLDPTAEFEADFEGTVDAKEPENVAIDESDESISVFKFSSPEDELEAEAEKERAEIKKLLGSAAKPAPAPAPVVEDPEVVEPVEEPVEEEKEYVMPDPDDEEFEVYDFSDKKAPSAAKKPLENAADSKRKNPLKDREFNTMTQRDSIKDRFLDSLISIKIRSGATFIFALAMLVIEVLTATRVIGYDLFAGSELYTVGLVDFLLAACIFIMTLPEIVRAVKNLFGKKLLPEILPLPAFILLGLYTLTVCLAGERSYPLLGFLFALLTIPALAGALYRTKGDFIAFKKISQLDEKQAIDLQNTRDLPAENKALDGAVDEYKSKLSRTFSASFISDFFKNSNVEHSYPKHVGLVYGVPFAVGFIAGVIAFFLSWSFVTAMAVFTFVVMIGCPAFAIIAGRSAYFYSQRVALLSDSTAIGADAYRRYSAVDVFAFDDTDIFGQDDVNLKRFMLYGDRGNMDKVMRQMCALFAAVGGPLDGMFSEIIDNRVRHKTATKVIIEDDGICGDVAGHKICVGSEEYMHRNGIAIPSAAVTRDTGMSFDTIKVMYAAEDGEVNAKFYIRYSFSEEFTMMIPALRDAGIIPLVYTRDPNISSELLATLTAGNGEMRVMKIYKTVEEADSVESRANVRMVTYGDRLDAANMIVLAKKNHRFNLHVKFAEIVAMILGVTIAVALSIVGLDKYTLLIAALWQIISCFAVNLIAKSGFLSEGKKKDED